MATRISQIFGQRIIAEKLDFMKVSRRCVPLMYEQESCRRAIRRIVKEKVKSPRLQTVQLFTKVLDGEIFLVWDVWEGGIWCHRLRGRKAFAKAVYKRMRDRTTMNELCDCYVRLCQTERGEADACANTRNKTIRLATCEGGNPTMLTIGAILKCLNGKMCIRWKETTTQPSHWVSVAFDDGNPEEWDVDIPSIDLMRYVS
jgi:hypothetical protein